jgi:hypothetical protein
MFGIGVYEMGAVPTGSVTETRFRGHMVFGTAEHNEFFHCRILLNPTTSVNIHEVLLHRGTFDSDMKALLNVGQLCVAIVTF